MITQASDNQIVWRSDAADPFGVQQPDEDPNGLGAFTYNPRFPGQWYDRETNLHYNGYRDYDPQVGRYVESDPIGLVGGINTYSYALNNSLRHFDSTGLFVPLVVPGICAAGGCEIIAAAATTDAVGWSSRPATGEPGSTYWPGKRPDGTYGDGRRYGPDGLPEIDYDRGHPGHHRGIGDHIHDWINGERSNDPRPYSPLPRPKKAQLPKNGWCPSN